MEPLCVCTCTVVFIACCSALNMCADVNGVCDAFLHIYNVSKSTSLCACMTLMRGFLCVCTCCCSIYRVSLQLCTCACVLTSDGVCSVTWHVAGVRGNVCCTLGMCLY